MGSAGFKISSKSTSPTSTSTGSTSTGSTSTGSISTSSGSRICKVTLAGEIDYAASLVMSRELDAAVASCGTAVVFDLQNVTLVDSEGIKLLLRAFRRASELSKRARVVRCSSAARRVIRLAGAERLLGMLEQPKAVSGLHARVP